MMQAHRFHDFSYGHRVHGHENVCARLHGHNGRVHFFCEGNQDMVGRVIDFRVIKMCLCTWVEDNWDHRFLIYEHDSWLPLLAEIDCSVVPVSFNPTAENMAAYLLNTIGPRTLVNTGVILTKVVLKETRKCGATVTLAY